MIVRVLAVAALLAVGFGNSPLQAACPGGVSKSFKVDGAVTTPSVFRLTDLQNDFSPAQENVTFFAEGAVETESYTGVLLWDLLNNPPVGGIVTNPNVKNDILSMIIIVTGTDCYTSVFGAGEIDPSFGGVQAMLAYLVGGQSIGTDGVAKIIVPGDKEGGRFVSNIAHIEVKAASKN